MARNAPLTSVLLLPGLGNSGPMHWQSAWEHHDATMIRVIQDDWDTPNCADWVKRLNEVIAVQPARVVLAAHSSSCALVAHWVCQAPPPQIQRIKGALLVAPSDPTGPNYPNGPTGFAPVPLLPLPFPSIVVASDDDPYVTDVTARSYATAWGAQFVLLLRAGHINSDSGLGLWQDGILLLDRLREQN